MIDNLHNIFAEKLKQIYQTREEFFKDIIAAFNLKPDQLILCEQQCVDGTVKFWLQLKEEYEECEWCGKVFVCPKK